MTIRTPIGMKIISLSRYRDFLWVRTRGGGLTLKILESNCISSHQTGNRQRHESNLRGFVISCTLEQGEVNVRLINLILFSYQIRKVRKII
jgi:hypothetical protein